MKTTALLLVAVITLGAAPARAAEVTAPHQRGFLTNLGLGLLIGGLLGVGVGVGGAVGSSEASTRLAAYGGSVTAAEQPSVDALRARLTGTSVLAGVGLAVGGVAAAFGISFILGDAPRTAVAFVPTSQGGVFVLSAGF